MSPMPVWVTQELVQQRHEELRRSAIGAPRRRRSRRVRRWWSGWFDRVVPRHAPSRRQRFPQQLGTSV